MIGIALRLELSVEYTVILISVGIILLLVGFYLGRKKK